MVGHYSSKDFVLLRVSKANEKFSKRKNSSVGFYETDEKSAVTLEDGLMSESFLFLSGILFGVIGFLGEILPNFRVKFELWCFSLVLFFDWSFKQTSGLKMLCLRSVPREL